MIIDTAKEPAHLELCLILVFKGKGGVTLFEKMWLSVYSRWKRSGPMI